MEKIISKGPTNTRTILIEIQDEDGKTTQEELRGVRCGLTFPTPVSPGYFLLLGQAVKTNLTGRYPLRFLTESKAEKPSELFRSLLDQIGVFHCWEIFTDRSEKNESYLKALKSAREERELQHVKVEFAPFYENFSHGVRLVREWFGDGDLQISKGTILHDQLKSITLEDLKESSQTSLFAVHALRFLIGAYDNSLSYPAPPRKKKRTEPDRKIHMEGVL
jgi:hypothetical protein